MRRCISQIPHSQYLKNQSNVKEMQNILIDFKFEILFRNNKDQYKKFFNAYRFGNGVYAKLDNFYILITPNRIKKVSRPGSKDLVLPDNWHKVAKIIPESKRKTR